jgi:hypothetical protein
MSIQSVSAARKDAKERISAKKEHGVVTIIYLRDHSSFSYVVAEPDEKKALHAAIENEAMFSLSKLWTVYQGIATQFFHVPGYTKLSDFVGVKFYESFTDAFGAAKKAKINTEAKPQKAKKAKEKKE